MHFSFQPGPIPGLVVVEPRVFSDERGFFFESFKESEFAVAGIRERFAQDNHSRSARGVLRGLHFQRQPHAQSKLVRVCRGSVWDVSVDLRPGSANYGQWFGLEISEANRLMIYIPAGFAHGFLSLENGSELLYKCTAEYDAGSDGGIRWDDPDLAISWPSLDIIVSEKDSALPSLRKLEASR